MMTLEQQQIAIAEWMGWKWLYKQRPSRYDLIKPDSVHIYIAQGWTLVAFPQPDEFCDYSTIPNYPFDLNAMHKAEEHLLVLHDVKLTDGIRPINDGTGKYMHELDLITKSEHSQGSLLWHGTFHWLHATAAQRSEALCRTLWPERWVA